MKREECRRILESGKRRYTIFDISRLEKEGVTTIARLPYTIRVLTENLLRRLDGKIVKEADLLQLAAWQPSYRQPLEIPFHPARVLMQDFTGVPALVDLAAMRDAMRALGGDPQAINPRIPVELIVDHSVQVDYSGTTSSRQGNVAKEYERNGERYTFLKWAQESFANVKIVPPNSGICHQVNLEFLGQVVIGASDPTATLAYPDTLVGTDSHTTMINGIGVLGWGVGGIEAEAVMLGEPYFMTIPAVAGVRLRGALPIGTNATDLVLRITELLRGHGVVDKFVEFFGPGVQGLSIPDRATIANMAPEYGATVGFFPVDEKTIAYLKLTNRALAAELVADYTQQTGLWYDPHCEPEYSEVIDLDLATIEPSVAGPARPQDRIRLQDLQASFGKRLTCQYQRDTNVKHISNFLSESGSCTHRAPTCEPAELKEITLQRHGQPLLLRDGSIVIAAITSCTNTSNPFVLLGAGLLARQAVRMGLRVPGHVKTSFAPGSKVVSQYLEEAGLLPYLEALGFHVAGYGCTTCIGNSGPLAPEIDQAIRSQDLTVAAVLSGNRNFEARIHQSVKANFLASPPLVVALAIAGRIDLDLGQEPLAYDPNGKAIYLADLWPDPEEIAALSQRYLRTDLYKSVYDQIFAGDSFWEELPTKVETNYTWEPQSEYIKRPPYFDHFPLTAPPPTDLQNGRALLLLGDSVTTDHISPAGAIPANYPAGTYLLGQQVAVSAFNSYGSRRGNHEVMLRGTFANIRLKNELAAPQEGGVTQKFPELKIDYIYNVAAAYRQEGIPLLVLGGKEYGTGSSRDWAAKGTTLLGIKAVIAESYERIHRGNLVGMGVLPLQFQAGESWRNLGLDGSETFAVHGLTTMIPRQALPVTATKSDGRQLTFTVTSRLMSEIEVDYFLNGGILAYVLRKFLSSPKSP